MKTVLITTSGTGDRLGMLTKYTNKSLVNVGDKYAICHIIENYDQDTEFIITIGYFGNIVKDFLLLAYPKHNFIFIEIDNYVGPGSSLGYSLLKSAAYLQKPFIFHCCDAIIMEQINFDETQNSLCVVKYNSSEQYTNITVDDSLLFTHIDKPWGYEELIECNDKYVVKKIFMKTGHSCSIQYHELKTETVLVFSGKLNIYIGDTFENLVKKEYLTGETITIKPYTVHRMEAVEDSIYYETSTNELWDVVRLQDNYNRV
jgi:NDP-sugar pyrophosphorylase family protein